MPMMVRVSILSSSLCCTCCPPPQHLPNSLPETKTSHPCPLRVGRLSLKSSVLEAFLLMKLCIADMSIQGPHVILKIVLKNKSVQGEMRNGRWGVSHGSRNRGFKKISYLPVTDNRVFLPPFGTSSFICSVFSPLKEICLH